MRAPTIITLGCRLNAYESEVIRQHAVTAGLDDAIVVNTCAVTAESVRQAGQHIRRLRRENPAAKIVVTGCAAQIEPQRFAAMPEVDHVIGNAEKMTAATYAGFAAADSERVVVNDIMSVRETAPHLIDAFGAMPRGYVQVQNGCDHRCTFCIIPFGRGVSRSVPAGEVVAQVQRLVETGSVEIVLTGVDITSYGPDLPGGMNLGRLVRQVLKHVPELKRLRLSSIDQTEIDSELIEVFASEPRLMPHLHLSMQSGDDMILKRMKRRHLSADAIGFCREMRRLRPDVVFGADLIAGFPTETDEMFSHTLDIVDECDLTFLHIFPYSPRAGTPAARMPQLPKSQIKERAARLRTKGDNVLQAYFGSLAGRTVEVMMENDNIGRTEHFAEVEIAPPSHPAGRLIAGLIARVSISGHDNRRLIGSIVT
jgi:threonylcarbamoyladenosine tRNA methylthiotransferase MtaB